MNLAIFAKGGICGCAFPPGDHLSDPAPGASFRGVQTRFRGQRQSDAGILSLLPVKRVIVGNPPAAD